MTGWGYQDRCDVVVEKVGEYECDPEYEFVTYKYNDNGTFGIGGFMEEIPGKHDNLWIYFWRISIQCLVEAPASNCLCDA